MVISVKAIDEAGEALAEELLAGRVLPGDEISATRKDGKTVFVKKNKVDKLK